MIPKLSAASPVLMTRAPTLVLVAVIAASISLGMPRVEALSMRGLASTTCLTTCPENAVLRPEAAEKECLTQYVDCKCSLPTLGNGYCSGKVTTVQTGAYSAKCVQELTQCSGSESSTSNTPSTAEEQECISTCPGNATRKAAAADKSCLNQQTDCTCSLPTLGNGYCSGSVNSVPTGVNTMRCEQELTPCSGSDSAGEPSSTAGEEECLSLCPANSTLKTTAVNKTCLNQQTDCTCVLPTLGNGFCSGSVSAVPTGTNTMLCEQVKTPCTTTSSQASQTQSHSKQLQTASFKISTRTYRFMTLANPLLRAEEALIHWPTPKSRVL
ncbi:Hypothetical Protein FCC1311_113622 [Hondaea fermentalgiana]|uniref:Uncharacterized protein n=1 Tax=Hondaea fermentalgiana TaxID=2315210 RepID=A0A2R5GXT5_9STRA|nr:Hypothetical Protein FCC1311_113622 [Hondaea fermentalgiana]|eukprot:GBG35139.1 Hypothetical Protein FCC1311_113622 [Hondaea fermentalgiana]